MKIKVKIMMLVMKGMSEKWVHIVSKIKITEIKLSAESNLLRIFMDFEQYEHIRV